MNIADITIEGIAICIIIALVIFASGFVLYIQSSVGDDIEE